MQIPQILIPAAGQSRRMLGRDKLLEPIGGVPLLARQTARACATGWPVLVTLGLDHRDRAAALSGLNVTVTEIDGSEGMAASLRTGATRAQDADRPLMVVLPDMPDLETGDLTGFGTAAQAAPDAVWRACTQDGTPGHPVWIPRHLLKGIATLSGDQGARAALKGADVHLHPLPGTRATTDLDTPEAWAAWRAANPGVA